MDLKNTVKIIAAMLIWGSIGIFVKSIKLPSIEIVFMRAAIASLFLILIKLVFYKKDKTEKIVKYELKPVLLIILAGIVLALNWLLLFQAYKYTTLTNSTLSYYMAPVFVVLLSPFIFREKLTIKVIIAVLMAMAGLALIVSHQSQGSGINYSHIKGIMCGLMAAVLYASVVMINKSVKGFSGFDKALIQILTSAAVLLPVILYRSSLHFDSLKTLMLVLIVGVIHTAIPYVLYFSSLEHIDAQKVSLLSYIDPMSAVIFGTLILREPIGIFHAIGGALILFSTLIINK